MSVPRFNPMQNDEAIARSLQDQEQESESARREQEERDARLAASLAVPAGSGAIPSTIAAPANMSTVSHPVSRVKCRKRNRTFGDMCAAVRRNGRPRAADKALS